MTNRLIIMIVIITFLNLLNNLTNSEPTRFIKKSDNSYQNRESAEDIKRSTFDLHSLYLTVGPSKNESERFIFTFTSQLEVKSPCIFDVFDKLNEFDDVDDC